MIMGAGISKLFPAGRLALGCNYWASHAGVHMWRDWCPRSVEKDLSSLAGAGIEWLRVFPLWPDFQPIHQLRGQNGVPVEIRFGERALPADPIGQAGVSGEMLERFTLLCRIAEANGLKLVIGLITGWMSGRLFVPPALEGLNPITDATSIAWQVRFVRAFVTALKNETAIVAWDLGNECNCMGPAPSADAAFVWAANLTNAIRVADPSRPVLSGMHSLSTSINAVGNPWHIEDQATLTDMLTTHPYPYWVRHADNEAIDALKTSFHATAESRFYSDIGAKPCIVEEIGSMGPMIASDDATADFARINMLSLWVNDCRAMAWWCGHDQTELEHAPYDWNGVEVELGLLKVDGTRKPVLDEMSKFSSFLAQMPFDTLPAPQTEAVCLISHNQDDWAVAFGTFVLAKQAGLEVRFAHVQQDIPEAPIYLLPSLTGPNPIPKRKWDELLGRVKRGATLYVSLSNGILPRFNEVVGAEIQSRARPRERTLSMSLAEEIVGSLKGAGSFTLPLLGADEYVVKLTSAAPLGGRIDNGAPVFWRNTYGLGAIYVLCAPIETELVRRPGVLDNLDAAPFWQIYGALKRNAAIERLVETSDGRLALTEHRLDDGSTIVAILNHNRDAVKADIWIKGGHAIEALRGNVKIAVNVTGSVEVPPFDGAILRLVPKLLS
jgi:hypothetical protein